MEHWIVPTAWAYSSKCNNRCLEHFFHGIWTRVFQDLIADLGPSVFLVPQYQIDSLSDGPIVPDESIATAAQADATEFTPNFLIVQTQVILQPTATATIKQLPFSSWNQVAIKAFIVPFIAELKHPPTRQPPSLRLFIEGLRNMFDKAYKSLDNQVENAFAMQSVNVDRIIIQGEERKTKHSEHPICYEDLGWEYMEQVRSNVELAKLPDNDWSKFIHLGSPASNQQLFLIHRFLCTECTTMLEILDNKNQDEDEDEEDQEQKEEDGVEGDEDVEGENNKDEWVWPSV
ncbi:hypothetical protein L208DRAFT_1382767 [Tricholoma matsutake]|nr:hypothetical protein L208DRAFT_1382767 [Tricholoma matsutake 945]